MKRIALVGSTGSIGTSTLKIVRHMPDQLKIVALAGGSNLDLIEAQAKEFAPKLVALHDKEKALELAKRLPGIEVVGGMEGVCAVASYSEADITVSAMTGTQGLIPTLSAIEAGKNVALANKEALVSGGSLVMRRAKEKNVAILPIDSEHSALFQCLNGEKRSSVRRLILTASGGPFRNMPSEKLCDISPEQALAHPTWRMGPKVTIDCSTLMNKGLEVIEARWLFDIPVNRIDVVIHPQSIIHSVVEFVDGSLMAQMGEPLMTTPIQYALTYPDRKPGILPPFDFFAHPTLQFFKPDVENFRCLGLAFNVLRQGGSSPCYLNAANEVLVNRFLQKQIAWREISCKLENLLDKHRLRAADSLEEILNIDEEARREAATC